MGAALLELFQAEPEPASSRLRLADWPDGQGDNPLFVAQRFGPNNDGNVFIPTDQVELNALGDSQFVGGADGGAQGFGGVNTGFSHGGSIHGGVETQPHDMVHVLVGGSDPDSGLPGLMSDPDTAGLDPIFWLHHANIDRLWEVWDEMPTSTGEPTDPNWVNGPASIGERAFVLPEPGQNLTYTPGDMKNMAALGYNYDDVLRPSAAPQMVARLQRFGMTAAAAHSVVRSTAMAGPKSTELLGASGSLRVSAPRRRRRSRSIPPCSAR